MVQGSLKIPLRNIKMASKILKFCMSKNCSCMLILVATIIWKSRLYADVRASNLFARRDSKSGKI